MQESVKCTDSIYLSDWDTSLESMQSRFVNSPMDRESNTRGKNLVDLYIQFCFWFRVLYYSQNVGGGCGYISPHERHDPCSCSFPDWLAEFNCSRVIGPRASVSCWLVAEQLPQSHTTLQSPWGSLKHGSWLPSASKSGRDNKHFGS